MAQADDVRQNQTIITNFHRGPNNDGRFRVAPSDMHFTVCNLRYVAFSFSRQHAVYTASPPCSSLFLTPYVPLLGSAGARKGEFRGLFELLLDRARCLPGPLPFIPLEPPRGFGPLPLALR